MFVRYSTAILWLIHGIFMAAMLAWCPASFAADDARRDLSPAERKELQSIAAEFRRAKTSPEARLALIDKAAAINATGVEPLAEIVLKELHKELGSYRQQFMKGAAMAAAARVTPDALAEVAALRAKILEVTKREALSKEMIVEISDPALARLKEIILVDRSEVFAKTPMLEQRREALKPLGQLWEACAKHLQDEGAESAPSFDDYLAKEEELATALALPMDQSTRQVLAANAALTARIDPEEARCILDLNVTRNLLGLKPLTIDLALVAAARDHSQDMEKLNFFAHESPVAGKATPWDRAKRFNTSASGENIASGAREGAAANMQWWHSPGHHKNMLGDHQRVGVGRSGRLWTELLGS